MTPIRVLMVEDSEDDAALIAREIQRGGYELAFTRVDSEEGMRAALNEKVWDLVVCDYSMPHFSGSDALRLLRSTGAECPFIFVSGTIGEDTAVAALKQGAQDYVMKDNLKRLLPAIRRELFEAKQRIEFEGLEKEIERLQKFEGIGRLAGGVAHDFNNALGVIVGWAQLGYERAPIESPFRDMFQKIRDQAERSAGLTTQLLAFARRQVLQPRNLDLNILVSETLSLLRSVMGSPVEIVFTPGKEPHVVLVDPTQIEQVLTNLCLNARDAMPEGGHLTVETQRTEITEEFSQKHSYATPGKYIVLTVSDTGTGMDTATLDHIFEPFFTTKPPGKGTGLGLATVYGITKQHGGFVTVHSEINKGTAFRIFLPASNNAPQPSAIKTPQSPSGGSELILVAEDHDGLRELIRTTLESRGSRTVLATNGEEAVRKFEEHKDSIALILMDVMMPALKGPEAYARIRVSSPGVPVIFTSGHAADLIPNNSTFEEAVFLEKPYTPATLAQTVRNRLDELKRTGKARPN
jgi:two-component system cell cycle sensor histidine kinase/response regulator CckA